MVDEHQANEQHAKERQGDPAGRPVGPRVDAGLDHLQAAARELIGAARAFLDVVEDVVEDRDKMGEMAQAVGSVAEAAARGVRRAGFDPLDSFGARGNSRDGRDGRDDRDGRSRPAPAGRVQHIRVS